MVRITDEFERELQEEIEESAMPERGVTRKLLKTGGRFCVTLRPEWCLQWGVEVGSKVLLFIDEDGRLCITPATDLWRREMEKYYELVERKVVKVGNSLAVSVPKDILEEDLGWEKKKLLRYSDYATVYEPYDLRRQREEYRKMLAPPEPEKVAVREEARAEEVEEAVEPEVDRRPRKVLAVSAVILGLVMAGFICLQERNIIIENTESEWAGTFNNTVAVGGTLQLKPKFMESCENGWTLTSSEGNLAVQNWSEWYKEGTGSVAVGEILDREIAKLKNEAEASKTLDVTGVDTILIDLYGDMSLHGHMSQELEVGSEKFQWINKSFKDTISVDIPGNSVTISLKVKNTWGAGGRLPAATLAADFIRSEEFASKDGAHVTNWRDMGERRSWDELRTVAFIDNYMSVKTTFQVGNDEKKVIGTKVISHLDNGTNTYDISMLESARYVRIETELYTEDITRSPIVYEYTIVG